MICFCLARADKSVDLECKLHCSCSSTSHLFISRFRLVYCMCYCFSHNLIDLIWLAYFLLRDYLSYKFTRFFIYFLLLSDEGPMLETLDYTIRIGAVHRPFHYLISTFINTIRYIYISLNLRFSQCILLPYSTSNILVTHHLNTRGASHSTTNSIGVNVNTWLATSLLISRINDSR